MFVINFSFGSDSHVTVPLQGHKSQLGIGVGESCEAALAYYHKAAKVGKWYSTVLCSDWTQEIGPSYCMLVDGIKLFDLL